MRILIPSIVLGPLMLVGALPVAADQPAAFATQIQLAAGNDATGDRDTYSQKARDDMQEWQRKLHDFGTRTQAEGRKDAAAAQHDLNEAWSKAEATANKLQTAGEDGWENAKTSYEKASSDLANSWDKVRDQFK
jgi:hypothetical protein